MPDPKGVLRTSAQGMRTRDIFMKFGPMTFDHVVFCAPPGGNEVSLGKSREHIRWRVCREYLKRSRRLLAPARSGLFTARFSLLAPQDYAAEVRAASRWWKKSFLFTSSSAVYGDGAEGEEALTVEGSPLKDPALHPRAAKLLRAEQVVLGCGGTVLRLAG